MPIDPDIAQALERAREAGLLPITGGDHLAVRAQYREAALMRRGEGYVPEPVGAVGESELPGPAGPVAARVYVPEDAIDAVIVYLHGGGWVIGDLDTHDPIARGLANGTRAVVAAIDYRLAPEAPYPAPLEDAWAALTWAAAKWPGHRLVVAGDSAGAGLAAACALRARDAPDGPAIVAQLLIYPALDPTLSGASVARNGTGHWLERTDMEWFLSHYMPDGPPDGDSLAAPLSAPTLAGLPPAVIAVAEYDPLHDDGARYAERLREDGVAVTLFPGDGLTHGWFGMVELSPAAARAAAEVRAALARLRT